MKLTKADVEDAYKRLAPVVKMTPLEKNGRLSKKHGAEVYLKREDLQIVRSYKLRGAYNFMVGLDQHEKDKGVVCASAGNHAQGVAFASKRLGVKSTIYMPENTPLQKIRMVKNFGDKNIKIVLRGNTYDEAASLAQDFALKSSKLFVHPFDDEKVVAGQGTVAIEVLSQLKRQPDVVVVPVGGGGLMAGIVTYLSEMAPNCKVYAVEPEGAESLSNALLNNKRIELNKISTFVDGASVKKVGKLGFQAAKTRGVECLSVPEGRLCHDMITLYQSEGIISEPAGALSVSALGLIPTKELKGKRIVCLVTGGNNDISRYPEIIEKSLVYQGLKHYFLVNFSQKPGALKNFVNNVLGPHDDITLFEYLKKNNRESGPALVGIQLLEKSNLKPLLNNLSKYDNRYEKINPNSSLYRFLV